MYEFFHKDLQIPEENIIISGRSIGSGPACHLAAKHNPKCLLLISPIKSVIGIAKKLCGKWADYILEERFNNLESATRVRCPAVIFHGLLDKMVPHQDSIDLILEGFTHTKAHLFLRRSMQHNKFDFESDLIKPMRHFFDFHEIPYYRCHLSNFFLSSFDFEENAEKRAKYRKCILNLGYIEHQANFHG